MEEREASEVAMLLEAYYMNLDSTWNKLEDVSETLDDAEVCFQSSICACASSSRLLQSAALLAGVDGPGDGHLQE